MTEPTDDQKIQALRDLLDDAFWVREDQRLRAVVVRRLSLAGVDASRTPYDGGVTHLGHRRLVSGSRPLRSLAWRRPETFHRWQVPQGQVMGIMAAVRALRRHRSDPGFSGGF